MNTRLSCCLLVGILLSASTAYAVTATGFAGDDVAARAYNSFVNVWIPIIVLICLGGVVGALYTGHRIAPKTAGFLFIIILLGGGLTYISAMSGGAIASGAELPQEIRDAAHTR
jgi:hypothetical protein